MSDSNDQEKRKARAQVGADWYKSRKGELLAHIRALEDFLTSYALISRLVEDTDSENDVTEQLRGALYMNAVVMYARQFLPSNTKYGGRRTYPTRHLKADARFDSKIHAHLIEVRNKLIAHDDGEQLPPELLVLNVSVDGAQEGPQPLVATLRSYSLSSAKGTKFLKSIQDHLEGCASVVGRTMHEGLTEFAVRTGGDPGGWALASDSLQNKPRRTIKTDALKPRQTERLFNLDDLTAEIISVPEGNLHNKAYTYRMLTYSVPLPSTTFKVGTGDVTFFMENVPPKTAVKPKRWMPAALRSLIEWGKKPLIPE